MLPIGSKSHLPNRRKRGLPAIVGPVDWFTDFPAVFTE